MTTTDNIFALEPGNTPAFERTALETFRFQADRCAVYREYLDRIGVIPAEVTRIEARTLNTSLLCTMMIVIGYSSYALIVIRSTANTPMDQNSPEDIFTLGEYLGREQYGTRPLFYGQ